MPPSQRGLLHAPSLLYSFLLHRAAPDTLHTHLFFLNHILQNVPRIDVNTMKAGTSVYKEALRNFLFEGVVNAPYSSLSKSVFRTFGEITRDVKQSLKLKTLAPRQLARKGTRSQRPSLKRGGQGLLFL